MANENLKKALEIAMIPEYEKLLSCEDKHIFSLRFERKIQKLIKRKKNPYCKLINTVRKCIACIVVIILAASLVIIRCIEK